MDRSVSELAIVIVLEDSVLHGLRVRLKLREVRIEVLQSAMLFLTGLLVLLSHFLRTVTRVLVFLLFRPCVVTA